MSAKTMAEVMGSHYIDLGRSDPDNTGYCICGGWVDGMGDSWDEHLEHALKDEGFGLLADAWDEGHKTGKKYPWGKRGFLTDDNPYRLGGPEIAARPECASCYAGTDCGQPHGGAA